MPVIPYLLSLCYLFLGIPLGIFFAIDFSILGYIFAGLSLFGFIASIVFYPLIAHFMGRGKENEEIAVKIYNIEGWIILRIIPSLLVIIIISIVIKSIIR